MKGGRTMKVKVKRLVDTVPGTRAQKCGPITHFTTTYITSRYEKSTYILYVFRSHKARVLCDLAFQRATVGYLIVGYRLHITTTAVTVRELSDLELTSYNHMI